MLCDKFDKTLILVYAILSFIGVLSCTEYEEPTPFFDGLILEYLVIENKYIYEFEGLGDREFKITEIENENL